MIEIKSCELAGLPFFFSASLARLKRCPLLCAIFAHRHFVSLVYNCFAVYAGAVR